VNGDTVTITPAPATSGVLPLGSTTRFGFETPEVGYCGTAVTKSSTEMASTSVPSK
jgi:hypothetical protein